MKDKIINELKFFLLILFMVAGIIYYYNFIWVLIGLPQTWWAYLLIGAAGGLTEIAYINWIRT